MAKLVDALGLGPSAARHGGSSPLPGTKKRLFGYNIFIDVTTNTTI